jgi:hypothetical protein
MLVALLAVPGAALGQKPTSLLEEVTLFAYHGEVGRDGSTSRKTRARLARAGRATMAVTVVGTPWRCTDES